MEGEKRAKGNLTMQWELVKPWVNRVGIMLEFLSFWLAAPEILGEERLRKLERGVERGMLLLTGAVSLVVLFALVLASGVAWITLVGGESAMWDWAPWGGVALIAAIGTWFLFIWDQKALMPLLRRLADDKRIRQRSLAVGAMLFVVGILLELIATF